MSAFSEYEAIIRHARYEESGACADLVHGMKQSHDSEDQGWEFREKHTDRPLTHHEVYSLALKNAFGALYERMEDHYGEGK